MKNLFISTALITLTAGAAFATPNSSACSPGNAIFCGPAGEPGRDGIDGKDGADGAPGRDGIDGKDGADGAPGRDGIDGRDGRNADTAAFDRQMRALRGHQAADRATGSLQTRTAAKGQWTGALGISGNEYGADGIAGGVRYGISDRADLYAIVGVSDRGDMSWGVGATFILGGN